MRAIESAAKAIRAEKPAGKRGRRLDADDARTGKALEKKLRAAGAKDASVQVLAGFTKHPARVRIELDITELETLAGAIHPRR